MRVVLTIMFIGIFIIQSCELLSEGEYVDSPLNELAHDHLQNPDSSIYYANKSLDLYNDNYNSYYSHFILGDAYTKQLDHENAVQHYLKALELIPEGEEFNKSNCYLYWCLGRIYKVNNQFEMSEYFYLKSMEYADETDRAGLLYNIGNLYSNSGKTEEAVKIYFQALDLARDEKQLNRQAKIYNKLGLVKMHLGSFDEAREEYFYEIILNDQISEYAKYAGKAYHNIGNTYMKQKDWKKALESFEKALEVKSKQSEKFVTYKDVGTCYYNLKDYHKANEYFLKASSLYNSVEVSNTSIDLYKLMHHNYREINDFETREVYINKYENELEKFIERREDLLQLAQAANISMVYQKSMKEIELSNQKKDSTFNIILIILISLSLATFLLVRTLKFSKINRQNLKVKKGLQTFLSELDHN